LASPNRIRGEVSRQIISPTFPAAVDDVFFEIARQKPSPAREIARDEVSPLNVSLDRSDRDVEDESDLAIAVGGLKLDTSKIEVFLQ
jgi:hypothetical protein